MALLAQQVPAGFKTVEALSLRAVKLAEQTRVFWFNNGPEWRRFSTFTILMQRRILRPEMELRVEMEKCEQKETPLQMGPSSCNYFFGCCSGVHGVNGDAGVRQRKNHGQVR